VKAIAEAHGGELICQSTQGHGTVAAIWIPDMSTPVTKAA
jgi:signal transduction histidine kinase